MSHEKDIASENVFPCVWKNEPKNHDVRVLVQSTISHLFLKGADATTQNPDEARDFKHTARALRYIKQNRLADVQVVLKFPKASDDINLAILHLLEKEKEKYSHKADRPQIER